MDDCYELLKDELNKFVNKSSEGIGELEEFLEEELNSSSDRDMEYIINFNYTKKSFLNKKILAKSQIITNHIHLGKNGEECILGNTFAENENYDLIYDKTYQKMNTINEDGSYSDYDLKDVDEVALLGHSCSESDYCFLKHYLN